MEIIYSKIDPKKILHMIHRVLVYEFKTGPYYGVDTDKENINE